MSRSINEEKSDITLLKDSDWRIIDGEVCRVIDFVPMASIKEEKVLAINPTTPYASVHLERRNFPGQKVTGFIAHKLDFIHLWRAFKDRGVKPDEEVIISWSTKHHKNWMYRILAFAMPRLWVMICHKGAFELITDPDSRPDLTGEARAKAELPIISWKPEVMR